MSTELSERAAVLDEREAFDDGADGSALRSLASTITTSRGYRPRAANGRFIRPPDELPADRFLDREISWLQFNERVLAAGRGRGPAAARAGQVPRDLQQQPRRVLHGPRRRPQAPDRHRHRGPVRRGARTARGAGEDQRGRALELQRMPGRPVPRTRSSRRWPSRASPSSAGTTSASERARAADTTFRRPLFPVLTPLAVDPAHPFPYISGLSLNLAVIAGQPEDRQGALRPGQGPAAAAAARPGRRRAPRGRYAVRFVPLEDVIAAHLDQLFPGMEVHEHHTFRVTRNEDVEVEEDDAENLLTAMEKELTRRRFGPPVRLEVEERHRRPRARPARRASCGVSDERGLPAARAAGPARPAPRRGPRARPT